MVKGSNESRPRIALGDKIRVRPMRESLAYLNHICPQPIPMYEMEGIIIAYTLASETCICEFIAPPKSFFWGGYCEPVSDDLVDAWSKVTYHARFTFERTGIVFCHRALAEVMTTPSLRKALFPSDTELTTPTLGALSTSPGSNAGVTTLLSSFSGTFAGLSGTAASPLSSLLPLVPSEALKDSSALLTPSAMQRLSGSSPLPHTTATTAKSHEPFFAELFSHDDDGAFSDLPPLVNDDEQSNHFNAEQLSAIKAIVSLPPPHTPSSLPPFIIYGPPGSGTKSHTVLYPS